jgi:hypothetical protein
MYFIGLPQNNLPKQEIFAGHQYYTAMNRDFNVIESSGDMYTIRMQDSGYFWDDKYMTSTPYFFNDTFVCTCGIAPVHKIPTYKTNTEVPDIRFRESFSFGYEGKTYSGIRVSNSPANENYRVMHLIDFVGCISFFGIFIREYNGIPLSGEQMRDKANDVIDSMRVANSIIYSNLNHGAAAAYGSGKGFMYNILGRRLVYNLTSHTSNNPADGLYIYRDESDLIVKKNIQDIHFFNLK